MAVVFDLLANVLRTIYPKVTYVSNITDVDDKIMVAAKESGEAIDAITRKFEKIYNEDMAALGVTKPDVQPRATEHIAEMIALIEAMIKRNHAYVAYPEPGKNQGHVLFHVPSFELYGGLSGRSRDEQIAGARVDVAPYKKDPADFVLWKPSAADQPGWDSPWGFGRPGWHIECSAMAEKHLGLPFDIHGGGADLKFPHHENEIAQSCCAHGKDDDLSAFAKMWVHNGFVTVEGEKMSKSLGNFVTVHELLGKPETDGAVIRIGLLSGHYRQPLDWGKQVMHQAQALYDRIGTVLVKLGDVEADNTRQIHEPIMEALLDDLNTPQAFAGLNELIKDINKSDASEHPRLKAVLQNTLGVLGIEIDQSVISAAMNIKGNFEVENLLTERTEAKKAKNFKRADEIRDKLKALGFAIEDTPEGPKARKI
jgi:cysteinyl-tRNA synthetase